MSAPFHHLYQATAAVLLCAGLFLSFRGGSPARQPDAAPRAVAPRPPLLPREENMISLFQGVSPSVVYITSITEMRDFFTLNLLKIPRGSGSGFVWNEDGYIVTNYHVVADARSWEVTLSDQSTWKAEFVGAEPDKDIAVLKINASNDRLPAISVGNSHDLKVGQSVLAIGNPFGLDQTLTTGVISGLGREIESVSRRPIRGVIQTDAAINPGNSGGPLLDSAGRLIGVNTAIYSPSGAYAGVGFAVPVDVVNRVVPQLIAYGRVIKPGLGITMAEDYVVQRLGLKGVLVVNVVPGGGAEKAGFNPTRRDRRGRILLGDLIIAIDDQAIVDSKGLFRALDEREVGDSVQVTVIRDGEAFKKAVILEAIK